MKWQSMTFLMVFFSFSLNTFALPEQSGDKDQYRTEPYSQLKGQFGISIWRLNKAGFLEVNPGVEGYNANLGWIKNFPVNKQWTFAMGFGLNYQTATIDASKRKGEAFPQPFQFDQPQAVDEFDINYHQFVVPLKIRYYFSDASNFFLEAGPEVGILAQANYAYTQDNKTISYDLKEKSSLIQLTGKLEIGYDFNWDGDPWSIGINGYYQASPVLSDSDLEMIPTGVNLFFRYGF